MPPKGLAKTRSIVAPGMWTTNYGMQPTTTWELN